MCRAPHHVTGGVCACVCLSQRATFLTNTIMWCFHSFDAFATRNSMLSFNTVCKDKWHILIFCHIFVAVLFIQPLRSASTFFPLWRSELQVFFFSSLFSCHINNVWWRYYCVAVSGYQMLLLHASFAYTSIGEAAHKEELMETANG